MAEEKTELPTQKKLRDSAKKGESYKSRDMIAACILGAGVLFLSTLSFSDVEAIFRDFIIRGDNISPAYAASKVLMLFLELTIPFVLVCIVATVLPSLLQSKFALAFEAIKFDLTSLDPIAGFQKIFALKTIKELIKALVYLMVFCLVIYLFYREYNNVLYSLVYAQTRSIAAIWLEGGVMLVLLCLGAFLFIILVDSIADYRLYIKELKMEKHEVKQEYKEQEGNPEVKHRRKELHQELLSAQTRNDIEQSNFILANPTHIAIGMFMDLNVAPLPFVSVVATNVKAQAVIAYAEKVGTPVFRDVPAARRLYKKVQLYSFVPVEELEPIIRIYEWLREIETTYMEDIGQQTEETAKEGQTAEETQAAKEKPEQKPEEKPKEGKEGEAQQKQQPPPAS